LNVSNRHPPLWILIYGLIIMAFGIFLLIIGSGIRAFLIFMVIGLSLIGLWLYLDIRKEEKQNKREVYLNTTQACLAQFVNIKKQIFVYNKNVHAVL
jgi:uncharacterized membrane protein